MSNVCLLRIIKTSTERGRQYAVYYALMWRRSDFITVEQNEEIESSKTIAATANGHTLIYSVGHFDLAKCS